MPCPKDYILLQKNLEATCDQPQITCFKSKKFKICATNMAILIDSSLLDKVCTKFIVNFLVFDVELHFPMIATNSSL